MSKSEHLLEGIELQAVKSNDKLDISDDAAKRNGRSNKKELIEHTETLLKRLAELQNVLHADGRFSVLLVLQGRDASGKDGTIRAVCGAMNPIGVQVTAFGPPTPLELKHDFLWRVHQAMPARGMFGVFNRSHYEDVLVVRVRGLAPKKVWEPRYQEINLFEEALAANGTIIRKCFLHISKDEQHERLAERLSDPTKNWKFRLGDLDDRALWDDYTDAYTDALTKCSTKHAPWFVVPSDSKTLRNYLIARMLVDTLESLDLKYPKIDPAVEAATKGFK